MSSSRLAIASAHHLAYAPQYVAQALGFFEREGVEVELLACPAGDSAIIDTLNNGQADLVLGSVLFALRMVQEGLSPVLVAQSNQNTRHWLMAREDQQTFVWGKLRGATVVVSPTNVPTPWVAFRQALFNKGLALDEVAFVIGYSAEQAVSEFKRGVGDFLLVDPESIEPRTGLKEVASVAAALGPVPWSVYCSTSVLAAEKNRPFVAFRQAVSAAAIWLYDNSAQEASRVLAKVFADKRATDIAAQVARYQRAELWVPDATVNPAHVATWDDALRRGGLMPNGLGLAQLCR
ncbi:ABC transporter substrate-binding protein [Aminobacter anthyllidis]|uniref:ABC transporter substrate-binding protein n=1 Tax=Aminobacter anthyllidis TaxID=1035067 RepID=A0A9X1AC91_9HYPH|nr:ABC transporter substrate-binding protein [Aminobacter anthyllidis]MBT1157240.1 ABC transporter substrate-binding protein [Aminobacter anthyllidis]